MNSPQLLSDEEQKQITLSYKPNPDDPRNWVYLILLKGQLDKDVAYYTKQKEQVATDLINYLGLHENELGFAEISNHISYEDFKAAYLKREG